MAWSAPFDEAPPAPPHVSATGRRSSGVEHSLGKGGVGCSIHPGGTSFSLISQLLRKAAQNSYQASIGRTWGEQEAFGAEYLRKNVSALFRLRSAGPTASIKISRFETTATGSIGRFPTRRFLLEPIARASQRQQSAPRAPVQLIALLHSGPPLIDSWKQNSARPRPAVEPPTTASSPAIANEERGDA